MDKFDFEKLEVYKMALEFIGKIYNMYGKLPYMIQKSIGSNLLNAAMSIACNIAEGSGRRSEKEKKRFFIISQGSTFECIPALRVLHQGQKITNEEFEYLYNTCCSISKMLSRLIVFFS